MNLEILINNSTRTNPIFFELGDCVDKLTSKNIRDTVDTKVNMPLMICFCQQIERLIDDKIETYEFTTTNI